MKKAIAASVFSVIIFVAAASAQVASCPKVTVTAPDEVAAGKLLMITANVSGGDPGVTPTYNWTVSAGAISGGQGTSTVKLEDTANLGGQSVTATVDVGGYSRDCSTSNSATATIARPIVPAAKVDEYGKLPWKNETARLDNLAIGLQQDPTAVAYLIYYEGRKAPAGEAKKAADKAMDYLMKIRGIALERLQLGHGGYRETLSLEYFLGPYDATPPMASPTVKEPDTQKPAVKPKPARKKT